MKKAFLLLFSCLVLTLSGFNKEPDYEQITFNFFISDILPSDFKDVAAFKFEGKTERSFSTLGKYSFCLKPQDRLESMIKEVARGKSLNSKKIDYRHVTQFSINGSSGAMSKLKIYPSVHVADNYYVFLVFEKAKYVVELNADGEISRSCKME